MSGHRDVVSRQYAAGCTVPLALQPRRGLGYFSDRRGEWAASRCPDKGDPISEPVAVVCGVITDVLGKNSIEVARLRRSIPLRSSGAIASSC